LGEISYPLYLVHENVGYVVMRSFYSHGAPPSVAILSATVVSLIAATALHFAVEVPSLALVKRWRTGSVSTAREGAGHPESSFGAE
jgi:peptidoglycan/LPS O-acetylase OafA/YrhL